MNRSARFLAASLVVVFSGCAGHLGYNDLRVEKPIFEEPTSNLPFAFKIDTRIQDAFVAESAGGIKAVHVKEFRKTLASGVKDTFPNAQMLEGMPARGYGVTLVDVRPSVISVRAFSAGSGATAYTSAEVKCEVAYGVAFFKDGTPKNITGKVLSRASTTEVFGMGRTCANGLEVMFADIRDKFAVFVAGK